MNSSQDESDSDSKRVSSAQTRSFASDVAKEIEKVNKMLATIQITKENKVKKKKSAKKSKGGKGGSKALNARLLLSPEQDSVKINPAVVLVDIKQEEIDDKATKLVTRRFCNKF